MTKAASKAKPDFLHSREGNLLSSIVLFLLAYALASRAIDTGSLIQYFVTFVLIGFGINRFIRIFKK